MSLEWNGDKIAEKMKAAQREGIMRTLGVWSGEQGSGCIPEAKELVHYQYGTLQRSIKMDDKGVVFTNTGAEVLWGSFDVNYAFWQEVLPTEKGGKKYLRPSADKHYPQLADNIRKAFEQCKTRE
jgi:hypothetical protein